MLGLLELVLDQWGWLVSGWWMRMPSSASCSWSGQIIKNRSSGRPKLLDSVSRFNCSLSFCGKQLCGLVEASVSGLCHVVSVLLTLDRVIV